MSIVMNSVSLKLLDSPGPVQGFLYRCLSMPKNQAVRTTVGLANVAALFLKFELSVDESSSVSKLLLYSSIKRLLWAGGCCDSRVGEATERKIGIPAPPAIGCRQTTSQGDNHCHLTTLFPSNALHIRVFQR